jgi:hypothetical protein
MINVNTGTDIDTDISTTPEPVGASTDKHSAKTLEPILCDVLATLSGFLPEVPLRHDLTYPDVFVKAGITDLKSYPDSNGLPIPYRWVQWAFCRLVDAGFASRAKRGTWQITAAGLRDYQRRNGITPPLTVGTPVIPLGPPEPAVEAKVEPVAPVEVPAEVVSLKVGDGLPDDFDMGGPYFRFLALAKAPCFGNYLDGHSKCEACPAQNPCLNKTTQLFIDLAGRFAIEEAAAVAAAERKAKAKYAPAAPTISAPLPPGVTTPNSNVQIEDGTSSRKIKCVVQSRCKSCGELIASGTEATWVRGKGGKNSTLLHNECYETLLTIGGAQ